MIETTPLVTVVTAVYNAEKFLRETIDSVLQQNYANIEFILINDASTDNSLEILLQYCDPRMIILSNSKNLGAGATRNIGLQQAKGKYIAIIDADDICLDNRISKEVDFLEKNPQIDICGAWRQNFGAIDGVSILPSEDLELKKMVLTTCCFWHSTVMIRTSSLRKYNLLYDPTYKSAQDFELWNRAAKYLKYHNLPEALVKYRVGHDQISTRRTDEQKRNALLIAQRGISELLRKPIKLCASLAEPTESIHNIANDFSVYADIPHNQNAKLLFKEDDLYDISRFNINTLINLNMDKGFRLFICYVKNVPSTMNNLKWLVKFFLRLTLPDNIKRILSKIKKIF